MAATILHEAVSERYEMAVAAGHIQAEIPRRDGMVVPMVEYRVPESGLFIRTSPQKMSWSMSVGNHQGDQVELPIGSQANFKGEPIKFVIDKTDTFVVFRRELHTLGSPAVDYLTDLVMRSEDVPGMGDQALDDMSPETLVTIDPEIGGALSVDVYARGLVAAALLKQRHTPNQRYVTFSPDSPFGDIDPANYWASSTAINGDLGCRLLLETEVNRKTLEPVEDVDILCRLTFPVIDAWETHDGTVPANDFQVLIEGTEAMMLNEGTDAGFSHFTSASLMRLGHILSNSSPYLPD